MYGSKSPIMALDGSYVWRFVLVQTHTGREKRDPMTTVMYDLWFFFARSLLIYEKQNQAGLDGLLPLFLICVEKGALTRFL